MNQSFIVTKQANGVYRWTATSSNNSLDRDSEIVSKMALEMDVHRTRLYGDGSDLRLFHLPYPIGGAPDYRAVSHGHLIETGEFHDTPVAKSIAEYIMANPQGTDGSGWGTSIGFYGSPNEEGVFEAIIVKERSVLPLSKAANPYTAFQIKEKQEMAMTKSQQEFLDALSGSPEMADVARAFLNAADQSKTLDEQGVQRKASTEAEVITPAKPAAAEKAEGDAASADACYDADGNKLPVDSNEPCHDADGTLRGKAASEGEKALEGLSLDDLAGAIDTHVKHALQSSEALLTIANVIKEQNATVVAQSERIKALEAQDDTIRTHYETPRIRLTEMLASRSKATEVPDTDKLVQAANGALESDETLMAALGFKPTNGN